VVKNEKAAPESFRGGLLACQGVVALVSENKSGLAPSIVFLPYRDDLIDRDVAELAIIILELQNPVFDVDDLAANAVIGSTKGIDSLTHQGSQEIFHYFLPL
jgi:hypothetical protein